MYGRTFCTIGRKRFPIILDRFWKFCVRILSWFEGDSHIVTAKAFYPLLLAVSRKVGVHFQPIWLSSTLGRIIFIHRLRSTVSISLSQSDWLPRDCLILNIYSKLRFPRFCSIFTDTLLYQATFARWFLTFIVLPKSPHATFDCSRIPRSLNCIFVFWDIFDTDCITPWLYAICCNVASVKSIPYL